MCSLSGLVWLSDLVSGFLVARLGDFSGARVAWSVRSPASRDNVSLSNVRHYILLPEGSSGLIILVVVAV